MEKKEEATGEIHKWWHFFEIANKLLYFIQITSKSLQNKKITNKPSKIKIPTKTQNKSLNEIN